MILFPFSNQLNFKKKSVSQSNFDLICYRNLKSLGKKMFTNSQIGRLRRPFARPSGSTGKGIVHGYVRNDIFARNDIMFGMTSCSE